MKIFPDFTDIELWAKKGITSDFIMKSLQLGIHPIHWVKEDILKDLYENYTLRKCYSKCGEYYKINYGNVMFRDFQNYQFLYFCRGDVIHVDSDIIVTKAPNKFWNLDENIITKTENLNWDEKFITIEKMDGMLIIPYKTDDGEWKLTSRGSFEYEVIQIAESFFNDNYIKLCEEFLKNNLYPTFEIISTESFIKVEYSNDKHGLYLLGAVDVFGNFNDLESQFKMAQEYNIKTPQTYELQNKTEVENFVNSFKNYYEFEGIVLTFDTQGSVKIKSNKYCETDIQKLDKLETLYDTWNENKLDDILPHLPPIKVETVIKSINKFKAHKLFLNDEYDKIIPIIKNMKDVKDVVDYIEENCEPKHFHLFINKYKNNIIAIQKSIRTLTLEKLKSEEI